VRPRRDSLHDVPLIRRRDLLAVATFSSGLGNAQEIRREPFLKAPGNGTAVMAFAYYTKSKGLDLLSIEQRWSRSDTMDICYIRRSKDHGKTWSPPVPRLTGERRPDGMLRRHLRGCWVDPNTGAAIEFWIEGLLPTDDPLEGMRRWQIHYRVSRDGFRTSTPAQSIRQAGLSADEILPGVYPGKNSVMTGDQGSQPLAVPGGFLLPVTIAPIDADGKLFNPGGGYTYHYAAVLHARWKSPLELEWRLSEPVHGDPQRSMRGLDEPTIARLRDGRYLMVIRGSNDRKPSLPGRRWMSVSQDGIRWSTPEPWTYHGGEAFYSPSSCSQLCHHSNGRLYWIGNITPENPKGNRPRYPLVIGEVDFDSGLLRKESIRTVDTRQPEDDPLLTLSNFYAREDRVTREIVIHLTRLFALQNGWQGDAFAYRVPL
jgi:hypothetical protein